MKRTDILRAIRTLTPLLQRKSLLECGMGPAFDRHRSLELDEVIAKLDQVKEGRFKQC